MAGRFFRDPGAGVEIQLPPFPRTRRFGVRNAVPYLTRCQYTLLLTGTQCPHPRPKMARGKNPKACFNRARARGAQKDIGLVNDKLVLKGLEDGTKRNHWRQ